MIAGNLCRCTGYQNIVTSVLRAAEIAQRERERMTTKLFGTGPAGRGPAASCAATAGTSTTSPSARRPLHAAVLRSPHAHARIADIDVADVLDVDGRARGLDLRRPRPARWPSRCRC